MNGITQDIQHAEIYLLVTPRTLSRRVMNELAARLALAGPVQVLDGGNLFDAYGIARQVRQQTHQLEMVLEQLGIARAFTCHQMASLLAAQKTRPVPLLVFDLLTTFYDENVPLAERRLMLERCLGHLERLSRRAPVIINAYPANTAIPTVTSQSDDLFTLLSDVAGQVWHFETPSPAAQPRLL
jgi:hypothetical protein